jgi:hypothetical protein
MGEEWPEKTGRIAKIYRGADRESGFGRRSLSCCGQWEPSGRAPAHGLIRGVGSAAAAGEGRGVKLSLMRRKRRLAGSWTVFGKAEALFFVL